MILAIDTSTRNASVAVAHDGQIVASRAWYSAVSHSTQLMPSVVQILESVGMRPRGLDAVAVALGPGGFSALRTGLSVAKGIAMASKIPIIGIGSLDLEAHPFRDSGVAVCALLEAGRGEVASAVLIQPTHARGSGTIGSPGPMSCWRKSTPGQRVFSCSAVKASPHGRRPYSPG